MCKEKLIYKSRIDLLRQLMRKEAIEAYIVPSSDPHLSEYLPDYWKAREWFTGFSGSAGLLIVTFSAGVLFVDSRYWQQAQQQLDGTGIELIKILPGRKFDHIDWIIEHFSTKSFKKILVAIPGSMVSVANFFKYRERLAKVNIALNTDINLLEKIWTDRPLLPSQLIQEHPISYAITDRRTKLQLVANEIKHYGAKWHFISSLDDIGWMLNLRGQDVPCNPVFLAYLLVSSHANAYLFTDSCKVSAELSDVLQADLVYLRPYEHIGLFLDMLSMDECVLFDSKRTNLSIMERLPSFNKMKQVYEQKSFAPYFSKFTGSIIDQPNPSIFLKACKNDAQISHVRESMRKDGVALVEFFAFLEEALLAKDMMSELTIEEKLSDFRSSQPDYVGPSFNTIAAFKENAALPHYTASLRHFSVIKGNGLLLIDSGGQYLGGTTDVTRMIPIGAISLEERIDCTLVLKGLIALSRAKFPFGIKAPMLDSIARAPLWSELIDYGHGTGHGVGYFLNVHEGPNSISYSADLSLQVGLQPGMISSIEPGIYRLGKWGVRIENLVVVKASAPSEFGDFLEFETLTVAPIDYRCLEIELLNFEELTWLNDYHQYVSKILGPYLSVRAKKWLDTMTMSFEELSKLSLT